MLFAFKLFLCGRYFIILLRKWTNVAKKMKTKLLCLCNCIFAFNECCLLLCLWIKQVVVWSVCGRFGGPFSIRSVRVGEGAIAREHELPMGFFLMHPWTLKKAVRTVVLVQYQLLSRIDHEQRDSTCLRNIGSIAHSDTNNLRSDINN
jgi:hypothetical protein